MNPYFVDDDDSEKEKMEEIKSKLGAKTYMDLNDSSYKSDNKNEFANT